MSHQKRRGHLKIYLGYAAGVGKTYQMLQDAHELKAHGVDLVLAFLEPQGRSDLIERSKEFEMVPLLRSAFVAPGWVSDDAFLAGYGAAQAIPGPLFTFAAYLGAVAEPSPHGVMGAALGLIGIFLPGILILIGTLPFWETFRARGAAQAAMRGINAAVVGILCGAFYDPVWTSSVKTTGDFGAALVGFVLLIMWRAPPLLFAFSQALIAFRRRSCCSAGTIAEAALASPRRSDGPTKSRRRTSPISTTPRIRSRLTSRSACCGSSTATSARAKPLWR